jgi:uncharacterized protein YjbJ (UPF0337 family)
MMDKGEGKMKEAAGAITGDEDKKAEGRAQKRKADAEEKATQKERTGKRRRKPTERRESGTSKSAKTRDCWVASRIPCRDAIDALSHN